jgi:hypothetical protein
MNETLEYPTIIESNTLVPAPLSMTQAALAPLTQIETGLRALAERYRAVAFDLTTPKGMADAKAARHDLRENGRYAGQRVTVPAFLKAAA